MVHRFRVNRKTMPRRKPAKNRPGSVCVTSVLMVAVMATVMAEVVMVGDGRDVEGFAEKNGAS